MHRLTSHHLTELLFYFDVSLDLLFLTSSQGSQTFFHDKWNSFNLVMHILYGISFVIWVSTTIYARNFWIYVWMEEHPSMNETVKSDWTAVMRMFNDQFEHRYSLDSGDPVLFSEAFFSLATIMAFLRVLQVRSDTFLRHYVCKAY